MYYEIRLKGHLDSYWQQWFEGMSISNQENGETLLSGPVADQAKLHGLLNRVRNTGLPLLALQLVEAPGFSAQS
jgi:hypothetical protein